jgi:acyl-CoA synthetase (AMP-forming)/AMP-acid ligase II
MFPNHLNRHSLAMKRFMTLIGLCGIVLAGAHAVPAQPASAPAILKRQINDCMTRRMGANRTLSYNDAMRMCKERVQPAKEALASISPSISPSEPGTKMP